MREHFFNMPVYLWLMLFTLSCPLFLSFDKKVHFFRRWKYYFLTFWIPAIPFLIWDEVFTQQKIWGFNKEYLMGWNIGNLPIEEISFFIIVPFALIFIYECVSHQVSYLWLNNRVKPISIFLILLFLFTGLFFYDKKYTSVCFLSAAAGLASLYVYFPTTFFSRFYVSYCIALIPFALINGILTYLPVVWYNHQENLNLRLGSIPIEDAVYNFVLFLMYLAIYEWAKLKGEKS